MVYKKRYYKKKNGYKKKGYHPYIRASAPAVGYIAMKAARRVVKQYVNTEYKYWDTSLNNQIIDDNTDNSMNTVLNLIPQGDSGQTRNGNQIKITSVYIKGFIRGIDDQPNKIKLGLWVRKDHRRSASSTQYAQLYDLTDSESVNINAANRINAMRKSDSSHNNRLLKSYTVTLEKDDAVNKQFSIYYKFKNGLKTKWSEGSSSGAIGTVEKNLLFLNRISDQGDVDYPLLSYVCRVRYIDN